MALRTITVASSATALSAAQFDQIQNNLNEVLGEGSGSYGYGQDVMSQPLITSADPNPVFSNEHLNLLAAEITKVRLHQSGKLKATEVIPELLQ
jgi:hypothetical protein